MRISDWSSDVCSSDLADPWCWFAPPPLAPIDRFSKGTVWESLEPRAIIPSAPVLLELALEHLARNDRLHDLDRAARNLDDARIGIGAADRIFPHIAPAAEELEALVRGLAMKLGGDHLRHRGIDRIEFALHEQNDTLVGKDTRHHRPCLQIGEDELGVLEIDRKSTRLNSSH